jgi:hypothetical protein
MSSSEFPPQFPESDSESDYAQDRALTLFCTVWSSSDALQLQNLLDGAGIPFFMGPEKATGVDGVTSNFDDGVPVYVMNIGLPYAQRLLPYYNPENERPPVKDDEEDEAEEPAKRCPKCQSTELVLGELTDETEVIDGPLSKEKWCCDSCGYHWNEDASAAIG